VNGGPIPFSRNHKLKKKKVKEVQTVGIEESMGSYGVETTDSPDYGDGSYGDGIDRPKAVKQMSDKRKRAMLIKGVTNPADSMRRDLAHKAQMDVYKKNKGIVTETNVDHREIAAYGAVDIRRKTDGDDEVKMMTEDEVEALQVSPHTCTGSTHTGPVPPLFTPPCVHPFVHTGLCVGCAGRGESGEDAGGRREGAVSEGGAAGH